MWFLEYVNKSGSIGPPKKLGNNFQQSQITIYLFILYQYQEVGQMPAHLASQEKHEYNDVGKTERESSYDCT